jgi:histidinol-phosphate aminotransferase
VKRCIETNAAERKRMITSLERMGFKPVESESNFVFMNVGDGASTLSDDLLHLGVIVRPLAWMGFPKAIRISVGTAEENNKLFSALGKLMPERALKSELAPL